MRHTLGPVSSHGVLTTLCLCRLERGPTTTAEQLNGYGVVIVVVTVVVTMARVAAAPGLSESDGPRGRVREDRHGSVHDDTIESGTLGLDPTATLAAAAVDVNDSAELQGKSLALYPGVVAFAFLVTSYSAPPVTKVTVHPPLPRSRPPLEAADFCAVPIQTGASRPLPLRVNAQSRPPVAIGARPDAPESPAGDAPRPASAASATAGKPFARDRLFHPHPTSWCKLVAVWIPYVIVVAAGFVCAIGVFDHGIYDQQRNVGLGTILIGCGFGLTLMTPFTGMVLNSGFDAWLFRRAYAESTQQALDRRNWWLMQVGNNIVGGGFAGGVWFPLVVSLVISDDAGGLAFWQIVVAAGAYMLVLSLGESWFCLVTSMYFSVHELCRARLRWLVEARPTRQQARAMYYEMDYTFDLLTKYCAPTTVAIIAGTTVDIVLAAWYLAVIDMDIIPVVWFVGCGIIALVSLGMLVLINGEAFHFTSDFLLVFDSLPTAGAADALDLANHEMWLGIPARLKIENRLGSRGLNGGTAALLGKCDDHHGFVAYVAQRPLGVRLIGALVTAPVYARVCYLVLAVGSLVIRSALARDATASSPS